MRQASLGKFSRGKADCGRQGLLRFGWVGFGMVLHGRKGKVSLIKVGYA